MTLEKLVIIFQGEGGDTERKREGYFWTEEQFELVRVFMRQSVTGSVINSIDGVILVSMQKILSAYYMLFLHCTIW